MGHSLSWLAVENAKADSTRTRLGLEITKDAAEPGDGPLVGCALPGGWYVIAARGCDHELISEDAERADDRLEVDWFFEIPLLLAKGIVGFKHDEELPAGSEHGFVALRLVDGGPLAPVRSGEGAQPSSGHRSGRRPWWRFW